MKQVSSVLVLIGGLIAGYFAYPTLNQPTKSLNYEQLVKQISNSLKSRSDNQHDELLMHEVLEQNSRLNLQYEGQKQALEIERELRETVILKATLETLKTPEAKQALLNLTMRQTE